MKIHYMSDLHLEFAPLTDHQLETFPAGDILVLAGDIFVARCLDRSKTDRLSWEQRDRLNRLLNICAKNFDHILYVTGNHEYYGLNILKAHELITEHLPLEVTWLHDTHVTIGGVSFVGGTLWTNLDEGRGGILWKKGLNDSPMIG